MRSIVWFIHTSLDGFVAGPDGEMDWIHVDEEMFDYAGQRTNASDTALYGRVTYEMMDAYWPTAADQPNPSKHDIEHSRWYNKVDKVVLSRTMKGPHKPGVRVIGDPAIEEIARLKQAAGREIVMFGSPGAAHSLIAAGLVDDCWLFINPILLGRGAPLFAGIRDRLATRLVANHVFASGVVCLHYELESRT